MEEHDYDQCDDPARAEFYFKLGGKSYVLKEPSEDARVKYKATQLKGAKMVEGKISASLEAVSESQMVLVAYSTFDAESGKPLIPQQVRTWRTSVVADLHDRARKMGRIDEETDTADTIEKRIAADQAKLEALRNGDTEEERAKNLSSGTEAISG